ncbi:F-box/LRR-repeat protein 13 [Bienertia sinuspersici]
MKSSCKKNLKDEENGLGSLPDAILVCTLSLLPTKVEKIKNVVAPQLLLSILDYVNITGLQGNNDEVNLEGYILKNAIVLNHLYMRVYVGDVVEDEDARIGKEYKFSKGYIRLPITSLTTSVELSNQYLRASNDTTLSHNEIVILI